MGGEMVTLYRGNGRGNAMSSTGSGEIAIQGIGE
jgi:hypothetical protein